MVRVQRSTRPGQRQSKRALEHRLEAGREEAGEGSGLDRPREDREGGERRDDVAGARLRSLEMPRFEPGERGGMPQSTPRTDPIRHLGGGGVRARPTSCQPSCGATRASTVVASRRLPGS